MKLSVSLHTHTERCHHAVGAEREYIENAIAGGLKVIGFADHAPYDFPSFYNSRIRMSVSDMEDYFAVLLSLREEYRGVIDIKIGFEAEYYPAFFKRLIENVRRYPTDYLILGQHFLENEMSGKYAGIKTDSEDFLAAYVDQTSEGIDTGVFSYVAHPDLLKFTGNYSVFEKHYSRLIEHAVKMEIPLEINLLGIRAGRHYPDERFIKLCGEMGAPMCIGCDAHEPESAADITSFEKAAVFIEKYNVKYVENPVLRAVCGI